MKIGIVGYQGSGKSTLFHWLTGIAPDSSLTHESQSAAVSVPDPRLDELVAVYQPKKVSRASIHVVDSPGLSRDSEGNAAKLAKIRETACLVMVVGGFQGADAKKDLVSFEEELLIADLQLLLNRIERLELSIKKPKPTREQEQAELEILKSLAKHLETGRPLREYPMTPDVKRNIKAYQLLTDKPRLVIVNIDDFDSADSIQLDDATEAIAIPIRLQLELAEMEPEQRDNFCKEMDLAPLDRGDLLRKMMYLSGQMLFFTCSEKEVRTWLIPQGATAEDAAATIHTDLARNFVRAERMTVQDLVRVGSERALKAQQLVTKEPRGYVVQEGDILHILASS